jgi:hypothetical protein
MGNQASKRMKRKQNSTTKIHNYLLTNNRYDDDIDESNDDEVINDSDIENDILESSLINFMILLSLLKI